MKTFWCPVGVVDGESVLLWHHANSLKYNVEYSLRDSIAEENFKGSL